MPGASDHAREPRHHPFVSVEPGTVEPVLWSNRRRYVIMTVIEMNARASGELSSFPRGVRGSAQNLFRAVYWMARLHSLGKRRTIPNSRDAVLRYAIVWMREQYPNFEPVTR